MNVPAVSTFILIGHWLIVVGLSVRVIMRRPPVGVSLAWLAVVFSVPFAGAFVYLLFGEKRLGRDRVERIAASIGDVTRWQDALRVRFGPLQRPMNELAESLAHQTESAQGFPPLMGNQLELLSDYPAVFDRLIADIDATQRTIHMGFYIWHEGGRASDVLDALVRAAHRGVNCRAIADAFGSKAFLGSDAAQRLREAGVELTVALPTGAARTFAARTDLRNHRKIVVLDGQIAYSGSQNLVDPRFFRQESGVGEWVDAMVRIVGPASMSLDGVFLLDWATENGAAFEAPALPAATPTALTGSSVQIAPSGPDLQPEAIHRLLLTAIYSARRELVMTTPYFVPDDAILTALMTAAQRGVAVTLIVPARNDSFLVRHASVAHFDDLMGAGVKIALFNGGLLHTKSLAIDGEVTVFGSVNLDMRSLWLNFEISILVYDTSFTRRVRSLQDSYIRSSDWVDLDLWRQQPAGSRFMANTCRLLSPLL